MKSKLIRKEIPNDDLTPIHCFKTVGGVGCCILEFGKSSLVGIAPFATYRATGRSIEIEVHGKKRVLEGDPYEVLKDFIKERQAFGFICYDAVRLKELLPDRHPSIGIPDLFFHLYQTVITFDHDHHKIIYTHEGTQEELDAILAQCYESTRLKPFKNPKKLDIQASLSSKEYAALVETAKEYIKAGDLFQVVLSRTFQSAVQASAFEIYRAIRQTTLAPYLFFFEENDFAIAGGSPELLISVKEGMIESMPIAGTSLKGGHVTDLLEIPKECAEHVMLVDLARNDVGAIATVGSVRVTDYKAIQSFSHVNHIVSRVVGKLKSSLHPLDALKFSLPAGTVSGAPKIRAMEIIDQLENKRRGPYGGAIVAIDENGDLSSCLAIRMALIRNGEVQVQIGAGIVLDSEGEKEALETEYKARGILEAIELAEGGVE